jgi:hypothetical protein
MNNAVQLNHRRFPNAAAWIALLCIAQPVLDILSYWLGLLPHGNTISLSLRMLILALTIMFAWMLAERRIHMIIMLAILFVFWVLHAWSCCLNDYQSPISDFINFARTAQIPIMTLCLIVLLKQTPNPLPLLEKLFTVSLYFVSLITIIAVVTGTNVYSYPRWNVGYSGWFGWTNSQSAIYGVLTVFSVFPALERRDWLRSALRIAVGFLLLFFLGTRLAFAEIFFIAIASVLVMLMIRRFDWRSAAAILVLSGVCAACFSLSPMAVNQRLFQESVAEQQQTADDFDMTVDALYEKYMSAMVDRFGMDAVKNVYHNSRDVSVIGDVRLYKINYCKMVMSQLPITSKLFGFELAETRHQQSIFDVENDFHGIYFLFGMVGLTLLLGYLVYYAVKALIELFRTKSEERRMWLLAASISALILIINSYFSASVLRRPNASFYLSASLAVIALLTERRERSSA